MSFEYFEHPILDEEKLKGFKIQPGEYQFDCISVVPKVSSNGNNMLQLSLKVYDHEGRTHLMTDFLVAIDSMAYKIKHFWDSVGSPENYKKKNHWQDYQDKSGYVLIKPQKNKQTGKEENRIADYIVKEKSEDFIDDDVPF